MEIQDIKIIFFENSGIKQTLFKNTFWLALAEIVSKGVYFLVFIWLARYLGPQIYGQWSFALSFASFFAVFVDFGFTIFVIRELARDKAKSSEYIGNILTIKIILGLIVMALIALVIRFVSKETAIINLVYFLSAYIIINNFAAFFQAIFRANEKMEYEAASRIAQSIILLILSVFFIFSKSSIFIISLGFLIISFMGVAFSLFFLKKYLFLPSFKFNLIICKEIIKKVWPFFLSGLFYMIYFTMGSIMLGLFSKMKDVGYYNAAYNLFFAVFIIPDIITMSFFPKISYFYEKDKEQLKKVFSHYQIIMVCTGFLLSIILFLLGDFFIVKIYSLNYQPSIALLKILSFAVLLKSVSYIYNWFLFGSDEQKKVLSVSGFAALLNIIINYFLIAKYGAKGAAITTVATELFLLLFFYSYFKIKWRRIYSVEKGISLSIDWYNKNKTHGETKKPSN